MDYDDQTLEERRKRIISLSNEGKVQEMECLEDAIPCDDFAKLARTVPEPRCVAVRVLLASSDCSVDEALALAETMAASKRPQKSFWASLCCGKIQ